MATNPYFTQYHTQRFSFIGSPQQRDGSYIKDQRFLNMYPEMIKSPITEGKKYYLKKRPGTQLFENYAAGTGQGIFYWNNAVYTALNGVLYKDGLNILTLSTTGPIGFAEFRTDSIDAMFVCDGSGAWLLHQDNSTVPIVDPNFPRPHLPFPIFMDGYIFLGQPGLQRILNSTLGDPTTWPADGIIDAEMYPDSIVALAKVQNYIAAIGTESIEWFYDNANATGSPLQRNAPAVAQFGCPANATVNQTEKELILVGQTGNGGRTVWVLEGFQPSEIGTEPIREALDAEGVNINLASAFTIQSAGHKWYVLNLGFSGRTFVFDFEEKMWHEWSSGLTQAVFAYRFACDSALGYPILQSAQGGPLMVLTPGAYTDNGNPINCEVITSKIDFDTIKRKRFYRLSLTTDASNGTADVPMTINWSDDDYNTWVGNRTIMINGNYPTITQLGNARRRAFQFIYQQPYPLRMESFEVDIIQEVRR